MNAAALYSYINAEEILLELTLVRTTELVAQLLMPWRLSWWVIKRYIHESNFARLEAVRSMLSGSTYCMQAYHVLDSLLEVRESLKGAFII